MLYKCFVFAGKKDFLSNIVHLCNVGSMLGQRRWPNIEQHLWVTIPSNLKALCPGSKLGLALQTNWRYYCGYFETGWPHACTDTLWTQHICMTLYNSFCTVSSAGACGRRRMDTASHPCHPDIYKTAFSIHLVFNILDTSINTRVGVNYNHNRWLRFLIDYIVIIIIIVITFF